MSRWNEYPGRAVDLASFCEAGYGGCDGGLQGELCNNGQPRPAQWRRVDGSPVCDFHKAGVSARNRGGSMPITPRAKGAQHLYLLADPNRPGRWKVGRSLRVLRRADQLDLEVVAMWPVPESPLAYSSALANCLEHWVRLHFASECGGRITDTEYVQAPTDHDATRRAFWRSVAVAQHWLRHEGEPRDALDTAQLNAAASALDEAHPLTNNLKNGNRLAGKRAQRTRATNGGTCSRPDCDERSAPEFVVVSAHRCDRVWEYCSEDHATLDRALRDLGHL